MEVGVGLPTTTPGADGPRVLEWARRAEVGPFASLGVLDRMVYRSVEPFGALSAAAAVPSRVRLVTMVGIGPLRHPVLLAKQVATLDNFSGGRFLFGIGAGWLNEETEIMGGDFAHRWGQTREAIQVRLCTTLGG